MDIGKKTGRIVECLPNRQYKIRVDGSGRVTLRNRRFIKAETTHSPLISPEHGEKPQSPIRIKTTNGNQPLSEHQETPHEETTEATNENKKDAEPPEPPPNTTEESTNSLPEITKRKNALKRLADHNKPGRQESSINSRRLRGGREY